MRISLTLSKEQFDTLNLEKGLFSLSAWIRSRLFGKEAESFKNTYLREWVGFLSQIEHEWLKEVLDDIRGSSKTGGKSVVDIIKLRLKR
jgi:hypothetical protein